MRRIVMTFAKSDDGAVTVDWVVLTAVIVGFQIMLLIAPIRDAMVDLAEGIGIKATEVGEQMDQ